MNMLDGTALGDYGHPIFKRDGFICVYCGFDGNGFDGWRQLNASHLRPIGNGGTGAKDNLVTACNFCKSVTSRMMFSPDQSADAILKSKKERVSQRRKEFYKFWAKEVAPAVDALTPSQGGTYLPHPLMLDIKAFELTNDQLLQFCADNDDLFFELTARKELIVMPPAGSQTGRRESELNFQLALWARQDRSGIAFGASAGFVLPNGAVRSPDASWILQERWAEILDEDPEKFARSCPDFLLELRSPSDRLASAQTKMEEYIENGARLGWLIDPFHKRVYVYRPGAAPQVLDDPTTVSGEAVLPGFDLNLQEIW